MGLREYHRPPSSTKYQHIPIHMLKVNMMPILLLRCGIFQDETTFLKCKMWQDLIFPPFPLILTIHNKTRNVYYINSISFSFILTLRPKSICKTILIWINMNDSSVSHSNAPLWRPWCTDRKQSSAWRSSTQEGNSRSADVSFSKSSYLQLNAFHVWKPPLDSSVYLTISFSHLGCDIDHHAGVAQFLW